MGIVEESGYAGENLNHVYGYVGQNPLYWFDPWGLAEHTFNASPSNRNKHENANAWRSRDRVGERGDKNRRPPSKKPKGNKGLWPPKAIVPIVLPISPDNIERIIGMPETSLPYDPDTPLCI